jgi:hypothetical protein
MRKGEETLNEFLTLQIAERLEAIQGRDWYNLLLGREAVHSEDILASVIATLNKNDADFFREVIEEGIFAENTEAFRDCIDAQLKELTLVERIPQQIWQDNQLWHKEL